MMALAALCEVVRGQRDLAAFSQSLSQAKLRSLLCRKGRDGRYQYPKETTFQGVLLSQWFDECLGPASIRLKELAEVKDASGRRV